jgi:hypothetical protein
VIVETHSGRQVVIEIEEELWKVIRKWNYPRGTTYLETERCEHGLWVRSSIRDLKTAMGVS